MESKVESEGKVCNEGGGVAKSGRGIRKNISLEEILRLKSQGLSARAIAKITGCSHVSISNRLRNIYFDPEKIAYMKKHFPELILAEYIRAKDHITEKKLQKAGALDLHKILALLYKQYRLETDKSTENVSVNVNQITKEIAELEVKIRELEELDGGIDGGK